MNLIEQVENFVSKLLKDKLSNSYTYHNINHTREMVAAVLKLAEGMNVNTSDKEILLIAAWFHDTGYINGCANHENSSSAIVTQFLKEKGKPILLLWVFMSLIKN